MPILKEKNKERGITLIEIVVVIFIIGMFSMIMVNDFPKIIRQFAISRAAYKLAQDIRRTEDLGLSGVQIATISGEDVQAKGYGVYIDISSESTNKQYIIYADKGSAPNQQYDGNGQYCDNLSDDQLDCIVELINVNKQEPGIYIKEIHFSDNAESGVVASINFKPPNPDIKIRNMESPDVYQSNIDIVFGSDNNSSMIRTVSINRSGLVEVE